MKDIKIEAARKDFTALDSHIYISTNYDSIKILCTQAWHKADTIYDYAGGWEIGSVRQYSLGAGHNATCDRCLVEYARRVLKNNEKLFNKIINLADRNIR